MIIHEIHNLSNHYVIDLLKSGFQTATDEKIIKNYHPDYANENSNIFYILKNGRYRHNFGKYFVVEDNNKFIASAGWNQYDNNSDIALVLTRMYVLKEYRCQYIIGNHVLQKMLNETKNYNKVWLTVNKHNSAIYKWIQRTNLGLTPALFNNWPEIYKNFKPKGLMTIYNTEQLVSEYQK